MRQEWFWLLAAIAVLLCGCAADGGAALPWSDDFSDAGSWQAETDASAQVAVQDGVLRILVAVPNQLAWANAGLSLGDFHLTVEATQVAGPDDNEYGVLVRMQDHSNFYCFSISGDGYLLVSRFVDGRREPLGANWTPLEAVRQGQATNTLEVIAQGSLLTFLVNGEQVAQVTDTQFSRGDIGLYAGTFREPGAEVHFDSLVVTEP